MLYKVIYIAFIGAGGVNFGSVEGPWNHSQRVEKFHKKGIYKIRVLGISDIDTKRANKTLLTKLKRYPQLYESCKVYKSWEYMINNNSNINIIIIGVPPHVRGSLTNDMELKCLKLGIDLFVEKPISSTQPEDFLKYVKKINKYQKYKNIKSKLNNDRNPLISIGYMFRYHPIIQKAITIINNYRNKIKNIKNLNQYELNINHINATYNCAYPFIEKLFWWNENESGGPIVEQGTHFIDLIRYLCNTVNYKNKNDEKCINENIFDVDYDVNSLNVLCILGNNRNNNLLFDKYFSKIDLKNRNPILTSTQFVINDTVISFSHGVNLHGKKYKSKIEIWLDGLQLELMDLYQKISVLKVRESALNKNEKCNEYTITFDTSLDEYDPYYIELQHFFNACLDGNDNEIYSDYIDAYKTYQLTYDIKRKSRNKHYVNRMKMNNNSKL